MGKNIILLSKYPLKVLKIYHLEYFDICRFDVSQELELEAGLHYFIDALQVVKENRRNNVKIGVVMPSGKSSFPINREYLSQFRPSKLIDKKMLFLLP